MCRRKSVALQSMNEMSVLQNMDAAELCAKAKMLLNSYRHICWASLGSFQTVNEADFFLCDESVDRALDYLYSYSPEEDRRSFERTMKMLCDSRLMVEIVNDTMVQVQEFPDHGNIYFEILSKCYLSKFKYSGADLLEIFNMERSCFYDRKKEAIMVFGLAMWGTVLPKISALLQDADCSD